MNFRSTLSLLPTMAFVLLWSSGAIISEIGLRSGSPMALLLVRYGIALVVLVAYAAWNGHLLPEPASRRRVALTGLFMAGIYSSFYLLALEYGVTPGALATLLGVQPILTLFATERHVSKPRLLGLLGALAGLALVVFDGLSSMKFSALGLSFAALSLGGITIGSILQKKETQPPWVVLPLQFGVGLIFILAITPFSTLRFSLSPDFILSGIWLGLVISVSTTFLLYRLIARSNLVNVTSLLYFVPGMTALMDWVILGNAMSPVAIAGLAVVIFSLLLVFANSATRNQKAATQ